MIGIGTDLVEIERIERMHAKWDEKFTHRIFSERELAHCFAKRRPGPSLAVRFAAKEAVLKAMGKGLGACSFREIEVVNAPSGQPRLQLYGAAARIAAEQGISRWHISLSHSRHHASAVVMAE